MPHPLKSHFSRRFHIYRDITHSGADFRAMRNHTFHAFHTMLAAVSPRAHRSAPTHSRYLSLISVRAGAFGARKVSRKVSRRARHACCECMEHGREAGMRIRTGRCAHSAQPPRESVLRFGDLLAIPCVLTSRTNESAEASASRTAEASTYDEDLGWRYLSRPTRQMSCHHVGPLGGICHQLYSKNFRRALRARPLDVTTWLRHFVRSTVRSEEAYVGYRVSASRDRILRKKMCETVTGYSHVIPHTLYISVSGTSG